MKLRWIYVAGLFILFQSCQVTRELGEVTPETATEAYPIENLPMDTVSMAEMTLEEFFEDSVLLDLIRVGLQRNYSLGRAYKSIEMANAFYQQGRSAYYPTLSVSPQISYTVNSKNSQFGAIEGASRLMQNYRLGIDASWEADIWGKLKSQERMAFEDLQSAQVGLQVMQTELIAQVASLYYQLVALDARRHIALRTIDNRRASVETIESLKNAGMVTEVAVQQNVAQLHSTEALLIEIEENIYLLENTLNALLARPYEPIERVAWSEVSMPDYFTVGLPAQLLENRPDLRQAVHQIRGDFEQINVAKTFFYPALRLNAGTGLESVKLAKFFNPASLFANIAAGLTQPVLDRRQNKTQLEVAQLQFEQSMLGYEELYINAVKEVTDALTLAEKADEKLLVQQRELSALSNALDYSEELLNNGLADYLEVLIAQQQVLVTELGMVDARLQRISAVVSLYKSLGGGWR